MAYSLGWKSSFKIWMQYIVSEDYLFLLKCPNLEMMKLKLKEKNRLSYHLGSSFSVTLYCFPTDQI